MKVRLTENELVSLISKILKEEKSLIVEGTGTFADPYTDDDIQPDVDTVVDDIDGYVNQSNVNSIFTILSKYKNKVALDDTDIDNPKKVSALKRFADLYQDDEGVSLESDLNGIGTNTFSNAATKQLKQSVQILKNGIAQVVTDPAAAAANPAANASELKSCASKEAGFVGLNGWWRIVPFGNGEMRGFDDGRTNAGGNVFFVPQGAATQSHVAMAKCNNGVLEVGAWTKV
jgi:hypothetical protein